MKMKRFLSLGVACMLTLSQGIISYAEPAEDEVTPISVVDTVQQKSTEPFNIIISPNDVMYTNKETPDITFTVTGKNGSETVKLTEEHFNKLYRTYTLPFNIGEYAEGDELTLSYTSNSGVVLGNDDLMLQEGSSEKYTVETRDYGYTQDEDETASDYGKEFTDIRLVTSLRFTASKKSSGVTVTLMDSQGNILPNTKVRAMTTTQHYDTESDANGVVTIPFDTFKSAPTIYSLDKNYIQDERFGCSLTPWVNGLNYSIIFEKAEVTATSTQNVNMDVNISLSHTPLYECNIVSLTFENEAGSYTFDNLSLGNNTITLPQGTYTVTQTTDDFEPLTLQNVSTDTALTVNLTASHLLQVVNDSNTNDICKEFKVINIDSLSGIVFSVDNQYAVLPGQSLMLQDTASGRTAIVSIDPGTTLTEVNIVTGETIVKEAVVKNIPKTGDTISYVMIIMGIIIVALAILIFIYLKRNKKLNKHTINQGTKMLSLLLVGAIATSLVAPSMTAYASITQGNPAVAGGGVTNAYGNLQIWNEPYNVNADMVKLSLAINNVISLEEYNAHPNKDNILYIAEDAPYEALSDDKKFWWDNTSVYFPTTKETYDRAWAGGVYRWYNRDEGNGITFTGPGISYGSSAWWDFNLKTNIDEYWARLIPIDISSRYTPEDSYRNDFLWFFSEFFRNKHSRLYENYGDDLNDYCNNAFQDEEYKNKLINGYIDYLYDYALIDENLANDLREAFKKGTLVIMVETMVGGYVKDIDGDMYSAGKGYFVTVDDAVKLYKWVCDQSGKYNMIYPSFGEALAFGQDYVDAAARGVDATALWQTYGIGYGSGCSTAGSNCATWAHAPFSLIKVLKQAYLQTIKPKSDYYDNSNNPWGGWGFITLGTGEPFKEYAYPSIYGEINYTIVDENDNPIDTFTEFVEDYAISNMGNHRLKNFIELTSMSIPATVPHNGINYVADTTQEVLANIYITDTDNNVIYIVNTFGTDRDSILSGNESTNKDTTTSGASGWSYNILSNKADLVSDLALYLGNDETDGLYPNQYPTHANVKVVFNVKITEPKKPSDGIDTVPQWRIDKYFPSILNMYTPKAKQQYATVTLDKLKADTGCYASSSKLIPSSNIAWKVNAPDLSHLPFIANYKTSVSTVSFKHVTTPSASIGFTSDLLAYKTSDIDTLFLAKWVNQGNADYRNKGTGGDRTFSLNTSNGDAISAGNASTTVPLSLYWSWEPTETITHRHYTRYHYTCGGMYCSGHCGCKNSYSDVVLNFTKTNAEYDLSVIFNCYNSGTITPSDSTTGVVTEDNGVKTFTKQSSKTLSVYGEVPMLFTDSSSSHSNSIRFVTTDHKIDIKPISYHTLKYDTTITPTITGTSVATDVKAYNWLNDNSMSGAQMINRGSGTNTSYYTEGTLKATTYAIDMNSDKSVLKSAWNTSGYSAESINNDFLLSFASANTDGTYNATLTSTEKLLISEQEYGDDNTELTATSGATTSTEYKLTLRAGEIMAINGNTNWTSAYPDLVEPLERMKADHNGVFSVFASQKGDDLTEQEFADLSVAARQGSTSIQVNKGWYSEDSTVISLFVYETEFTLPSSVHSNKVPVSISGLESPQNKADFYTKAVEGNLMLRLSTQSDDTNSVSYLEYRTDNALWNGDTQKLYAVPNVSIQDTTR